MVRSPNDLCLWGQEDEVHPCPSSLTLSSKETLAISPNDPALCLRTVLCRGLAGSVGVHRHEDFFSI